MDLPNSSLANELHPDAVRQVTRSYIEAGSDLVQTNTFVASPLHLAMAGRSAEDSAAIVGQAVRLARQAVDDAGRPVFVAGSIGPSPGAIEADAGDTTFGIPDGQVREAHRLVAGTLAAAGADLLCIETMFSATRGGDRGRRGACGRAAGRGQPHAQVHARPQERGDRVPHRLGTLLRGPA